MYKRPESHYSLIKVQKIGSRNWKLLDRYKTPYGDVPAGFISNGASSPRVLWSIISPATRYFEASVLHDYLLYVRKRNPEIVPLSLCNKRFYLCAKDHGANPLVAYIAYKLVSAYTHIKEVL